MLRNTGVSGRSKDHILGRLCPRVVRFKPESPCRDLALHMGPTIADESDVRRSDAEGSGLIVEGILVARTKGTKAVEVIVLGACPLYCLVIPLSRRMDHCFGLLRMYARFSLTWRSHRTESRFTSSDASIQSTTDDGRHAIMSSLVDK